MKNVMKRNVEAKVQIKEVLKLGQKSVNYNWRVQ